MTVDEALKGCCPQTAIGRSRVADSIGAFAAGYAVSDGAEIARAIATFASGRDPVTDFVDEFVTFPGNATTDPAPIERPLRITRVDPDAGGITVDD